MNDTPHTTMKMGTALDPDAYGTTTITASGATEIDTAGYAWLTYICQAGDIASTGELTFTAQESATAGSGYASITGGAATTLTEAGTDSNKHVLISINLKKAARLRYHILARTVTTAGADAGAAYVLSQSQYLPFANAQADQVLVVT